MASTNGRSFQRPQYCLRKSLKIRRFLPRIIYCLLETDVLAYGTKELRKGAGVAR
jgi:hypothetical protein